MSCKHMKRLISLAVDGEITTADNNTLEAHTAVCEPCSRQYREMISMDQLLQPPAPIEPSPMLMAGINRKLDNKTSFSLFPRLKQCLNPLSPCFALVLFFILSFYLGHVFGHRYQEKTTHRQAHVVAAVNRAMDVTIFDDMPSDSFPSLYTQLMQDDKQQ